jgi:phosphoribosylformimino-5-aminoimidazole carboxamide ribotide isomerase
MVGRTGMEIIPVIDLKSEAVVHARMGQRDFYRPIQTPLARTSEPVDVISGIMAIYPFKTLYIADLDAIGNNGNNLNAILQVKQAFPAIEFWIDCGISDIDNAENWLKRDLGRLVLGSESLVDMTLIHHFAHSLRHVLSLDFRGKTFQGPPALLAKPEWWPQKVIAMTLDRVGSQSGPDFDRLTAVLTAAEASTIYAAGGIRDLNDLVVLKTTGVAGALIASSLHNGQITGADIRTLTR